MKNLLLFTFLTLISVVSFSQTFFKSEEFVACEYNYKTDEYDICTPVQQNSLFKVSSDETSVTIITDEGSSFYYIVERDVDYENGQFWYTVRFDGNTEYIMVFDVPGKEVRIFFPNDENGIVLHHIIIESWTTQN